MNIHESRRHESRRVNDTGAIQLAVFGHPITHSLSPEIHTQFAESLGINIDYRRIDCPAGQLAKQLDAFQAQSGRGCNLTVPLKNEGLGLAIQASAAARMAGAANTLIWKEGGWHADNTDGAGLIADFGNQQLNIRNQSILILGAGGAVAGILPALIDQQPSAICILNRSLDKAEQLARRFAATASIQTGNLEQTPAQAPFDLLIQATSLGHQGICPDIHPHWLKSGATMYDLNYGPAHQPLRAWCEARSIRCIDGRGMLVEQAASAFELFTGHKPDTAAVHAWIQS